MTNLIARSLFILIVFSASAGAVTYVPVGNENSLVKSDAPEKLIGPSNLVVRGLGLVVKSVDVKGVKADGRPPQYAECDKPPTAAEIGGSFEANRYVMTRTAASSLGIVGGVGNANLDGAGSQLVAVFDFSRSKVCLAPDGKTGVIYGQSIRTVTSFESTDTKANVTFPLVAATATVSGKTSSISVKNIGFDEPTMGAKAAALSLMSLSVESFEDFRKLYSELTAIATAETSKKQVERLGIVPAVDEDDLIDTLPVAFAIQQIKDAKSCEEAKLKYKDGDEAALKVLASTYVAIAGSCSSAKPNSQAIGKAKDYLRGMKVTK